MDADISAAIDRVLEEVRTLPSQLEILSERFPGADKLVRHVFYLSNHTIRVAYHRNHKFIDFTLREWLTDECLARIALEAP